VMFRVKLGVYSEIDKPDPLKGALALSLFNC
jgi:hypothetical protein